MTPLGKRRIQVGRDHMCGVGVPSGLWELRGKRDWGGYYIQLVANFSVNIRKEEEDGKGIPVNETMIIAQPATGHKPKE